MNKKIFERTINLLGEDKFKRLMSAHVLVVGLGGVGGTALECLIRSGLGHVTIVDMDKVSFSNLNRQILYTNKDVDMLKVDVAKKRIKEINSDVDVNIYPNKVDDKFLDDFQNMKFDFIIDAIDDIFGKVALAKFAERSKIPLIVSLGMANRTDPSKVSITKLNKTTTDPLAKKLRYEFKQCGLDISKINVCFSQEIPMKDGKNLNSVMSVPSSAGLNIAYYVIKTLLG